MKNPQPSRSLLGLSQKDAAMLFRVTISNWSMIDIGKRKLPAHATILQSKILEYIKSREETDKHIEKASEHVKKKLQDMLRDNELQQRLFTRKIASAVNKQTTQQKLSYLADFLKSDIETGKEIPFGHQNIINKAARKPAKDPAADLIKYEIAKDVLVFERSLIEKKIEEIQ